MSGKLAPPPKGVELEDEGAHELESSEDSFTDASEGHKAPSRSGNYSPMPITRVERVDDNPSYGEVPGTSAYAMRTQDAVPDEMEVVPDGMRSRSASLMRPKDHAFTTGGSSIPQLPKIIAEKIEPDQPAYGDVPGTAAYELRKADAVPDEIVKSPISAGSPATSPSVGSPTTSTHRSLAGERAAVASDKGNGENEPSTWVEEHDDDGFGDDFDDFEEGEEAAFGEFDDGSAEADTTFLSPDPPPVLTAQPSIPVLNFSDLETISDVQLACEPYLHSLFPSYTPTVSSDQTKPSAQIFLSDRSLSLYTQLIAPPPLAPPNWLRSRIRRLFLVSLGVPVDLDEILPASKQKKLILPSIHLRPAHERSPRESSDSRGLTDLANPTVGKLKSGHDSSTSLGSSASAQQRRSKKRAGGAGGGKDSSIQLAFDASEAMRLAQTTEVRLRGMSDEELKSHCEELSELAVKAAEVLRWWERKYHDAGMEKEAFEGVIENLVSFARKVRK